MILIVFLVDVEEVPERDIEDTKVLQSSSRISGVLAAPVLDVDAEVVDLKEEDLPVPALEDKVLEVDVDVGKDIGVLCRDASVFGSQFNGTAQWCARGAGTG